MASLFHKSIHAGRFSNLSCGIVALLLMMVLWAAPASVHAQTPNGPETTVEYDAQSGSYIKVTRLGDMVISREYMTFEE